MKKRNTTLLVVALAMAGLGGMPLALAADPEGDKLQTSPQNNVEAPATNNPATLEKNNIDRQVTNTRDLTMTTAKASATESIDIPSVANSHRDLQKFTTAMQAAGLTQTLQGEGPYTVFAPSDNAFAKLGKAAWEDLLKPENQQKLAQILSYHVVPGAVKAKELQAGDYITLDGNPLTAVVSDKDMMVNEGKIVEKDLIANNGVIHIIDTVLMPPARVPAMSEPMSSINE
jgi:uncharacterized surface protein with fasciclin (FAS1) repeats